MQGPWAPRKIPNPDYYKDDNPLQNIGKVSREVVLVFKQSFAALASMRARIIVT